jgi:hypothetical protein
VNFSQLQLRCEKFDDDDDDDDINNNNNDVANIQSVHLLIRSGFHTSRSLFDGLLWFLLPVGL